MRIFYSPDSDPMLLDTGARLNALHHQLKEFLASSAKDAIFEAEVTHSAEPYHEFLKGLRLQKAQGPIMLRMTADRWLELTGSEDYLAEYVSHFKFEECEEDAHHHPDNADYMARGSMRLIIEVASSRKADHAG